MPLGHGRYKSVLLLNRSLAFAALALLLLVACRQGTEPASVTCPSGDPLRGIYQPKRLQVLGACRWFHGTVLETAPRSDGDLHVLMKPDPGDTSLLNVVNVNSGGMIVEIVPGQDLPPPSVGVHLSVFGTWVLDTHNGWNEIHPVWAIRNLDTGTTVEALPPVPPRYTGGSND